MAVYVDDTLEHGVHVGSIRGRSCHMFADTPAELHAFAKRLGLRREWASDHTQPRSNLHYDLVPSKRTLAVRLGAREVTRAELVNLLRGGQP